MAMQPFTIDRPGSHLGITTTDPTITTAAELNTATIAEFTDGDFTCAISQVRMVPTGGTKTITRLATMCEAETEVPVPTLSTWQCEVTLVQDAGSTPSIQEYLEQNDSLTGWVYVSTAADDLPPKALARVILTAAPWGGEIEAPLSADVVFRCWEKPLFSYRPTSP